MESGRFLYLMEKFWHVQFMFVSTNVKIRGFMENSNEADGVVVGGGIVGCASAYHLSLKGFSDM